MKINAVRIKHKNPSPVKYNSSEGVLYNFCSNIIEINLERIASIPIIE